jgi:hypothetical protein
MTRLNREPPNAQAQSNEASESKSVGELRVLVRALADEELATLRQQQNNDWAPLLGEMYSKSRLAKWSRK